MSALGRSMRTSTGRLMAVDIAGWVIAQLLQHGRVRRGYLEAIRA